MLISTQPLANIGWALIIFIVRCSEFSIPTVLTPRGACSVFLFLLLWKDLQSSSRGNNVAVAPAMTDSIRWPHVAFPARGGGFSREADRVWYHSAVFGDTAGFPSNPLSTTTTTHTANHTSVQGRRSVSLLISWCNLGR